MSTDVIKEFNQLKKNVETAQTNIDQATGSLAEVKRSLKKDFQVDTLKKAKTKLEKLEEEQTEKKEELETAIENFEEKWDNDDD
jgi:predicted  nucleic acid-binding Zn-ribbon protein